MSSRKGARPTARKQKATGDGFVLRQSKGQLLATYGVLVIAAVAIGFPILFSVSLSFTPLNDIINGIYWPTSFYVENYVNAFNAQPFPQFIVNSAIWRVVVPMVKNTTVTLAIYFFLVIWNSYLWPLVSTTNNDVRTIQIGLRTLSSSEGLSDFGMMAAGAVITSIPTLALIFFGQKRLQEGMTRGALK